MYKLYLKIKRFIAVEDENKAAKLVAECFHWFCFTSSSRS